MLEARRYEGVEDGEEKWEQGVAMFYSPFKQCRARKHMQDLLDATGKQRRRDACYGVQVGRVSPIEDVEL